MIGSALKKYAIENSMKVSNGLAYGDFRGYATCFFEGQGYKAMVITARFTDNEKRADLLARLQEQQVKNEYRIRAATIESYRLAVVFNDTAGTMKKIRLFCDWLIPQLSDYGLTGSNICVECGNEMLSNSGWKLIGGIAYHLHDSCAESVNEAALAEQERLKEEEKGSYISGLIGALLGGLIGSVAWGLVMMAGYITSLIGLLIAWLADRGYRLCKGKNGKAKVLILIIAIVVGVVVGTFATDIIEIIKLINAGELGDFAYRDIVPLIIQVIRIDGEYRAAVIKNILMGFFFAALGVFGILKKAVNETKGFSMKNLP